MELETLLTCS